MNQKLKEIREKTFPLTEERIRNGSEFYYTVTEVEAIQTDTALSVIGEVEKAMDSLDFCKCEPLGSGEEYCNNGCNLRFKLASLKLELEKP